MTAAVLAGSFLASAGAAEPGTQKSTHQGVTVAVTPQNVTPAADNWQFRIVLDTHSQDLSDDLMRSTLLVDDTGKEHRPTAWKGPAAGGHHREGTLSFAPIKPAPAHVELRMQRPGEPEARSFRWPLR